MLILNHHNHIYYLQLKCLWLVLLYLNVSMCMTTVCIKILHKLGISYML